jgi:hypothetical protein
MAQDKGPGFSNRFTFASLPRTERGQPIVLGTDPKGENMVYCHGNRCRGPGDRLLTLAQCGGP